MMIDYTAWIEVLIRIIADGVLFGPQVTVFGFNTDDTLLNFISALSALITGFILALVPVITAIIKKNGQLAIASFFTCIIASLFLGFALSSHFCALFMLLILIEAKKKSNNKLQEN